MRARGFATVVLLALLAATTFAAQACDLACIAPSAGHACCPAAMSGDACAGAARVAAAVSNCNYPALAAVQITREARFAPGHDSLAAAVAGTQPLLSGRPSIHAHARHRSAHAATSPPQISVLRI